MGWAEIDSLIFGHTATYMQISEFLGALRLGWDVNGIIYHSNFVVCFGYPQKTISNSSALTLLTLINVAPLYKLLAMLKVLNWDDENERFPFSV